jgi:predicted nucleic acid-binding protein
MRTIIDSCVWIDFFAQRRHLDAVSELLLDGQAYVNPVVLAELRPTARKLGQKQLLAGLEAIDMLPLSIDWDEIESIQYRNLMSGMNGIGIMDIMIAQNAKQNEAIVFSTDKHMKHLGKLLSFAVRDE